MSGLKLQSPFHAGAIEKVHTASQPLWDAMHPIVTNLPRALNLRRRRADVDEGDSGPRFRSPVSARTQRDRTMQSLSPKNEEQTEEQTTKQQNQKQQKQTTKEYIHMSLQYTSPQEWPGSPVGRGRLGCGWVGPCGRPLAWAPPRHPIHRQPKRPKPHHPTTICFRTIILYTH